MKNKIVNKMKKLNKKALLNGDIPVSCIITKNNIIISSDYNKKYKNNNPFDHAEILAIKKACKKLKTPNLGDCELYVTLYPCTMCQAVINEARIKKVYYILNQNKIINNNISYEHMFDNSFKYFQNEIKTFFKDKR